MTEDLKNALVRQGQFLFRWRSYLPLILLFPGVAAIFQSRFFEDRFGDFIEDLWVLPCVLVSLSGLFVRWLTVGYAAPGTSGRNTKEQKAETLNTTGMYTLVRNPLYLGNFLAMLGVVLSLKVFWFALVFCLAYWIYIERIIITEEDFLIKKFGGVYQDWAARTPVFIPRFSEWKKPPQPFSFRKVLRRESYGLMGVATAFFIVEFALDVVIQGESLSEWTHDDWPWVAGFAASSAIFLTLRYLKKHTAVLNES